MQAKQYAEKLQLETTYSTNGKAIYQICLKTGEEGLVEDFLSPEGAIYTNDGFSPSDKKNIKTSPERV